MTGTRTCIRTSRPTAASSCTRRTRARTRISRRSSSGTSVLRSSTSRRVSELLEAFPGVKHINPQYSPDGRSLYFIANPEGFSDIFRMDLQTGELYQITRVATGVSGVTDMSPALSVADRTGRMLFSVFINAGQHIYGLEPARTVGTPVDRSIANPHSVAAVLPPVQAVGTGLVAEYLADPLRGLPPVEVALAWEV